MSKITILMTVHNGEKQIGKAIESILNQSFNDFELIIVNDGSTDKTETVVKMFPDKRITYLHNEKKNKAVALNTGLEKATGKYIARMEPQGFMHPDRLKIQHAIMEEKPSVEISATWVNLAIAPNNVQTLGSEAGIIKYPLEIMLNSNFMFAASVIINKDFLQKNKIKYKKGYSEFEDYKFFVDIAAKGGSFHIEPQILMDFIIYNNAEDKPREKENNPDETAYKIQGEILELLIKKHQTDSTHLNSLLHELKYFSDKKLLEPQKINELFGYLFMKMELSNKNRV